MNPPTRQRRRRGMFAPLAALAFAVGLGTAGASAAPGTTATASMSSSASQNAMTPVLSCAQVAQLDLGALPGAATEISSATALAAADNTQGLRDGQRLGRRPVGHPPRQELTGPCRPPGHSAPARQAARAVG